MIVMRIEVEIKAGGNTMRTAVSTDAAGLADVKAKAGRINDRLARKHGESSLSIRGRK